MNDLGFYLFQCAVCLFVFFLTPPFVLCIWEKKKTTKPQCVFNCFLHGLLTPGGCFIVLTKATPWHCLRKKKKKDTHRGTFHSLYKKRKKKKTKIKSTDLLERGGTARRSHLVCLLCDFCWIFDSNVCLCVCVWSHFKTCFTQPQDRKPLRLLPSVHSPLCSSPCVHWFHLLMTAVPEVTHSRVWSLMTLKKPVMC